MVAAWEFRGGQGPFSREERARLKGQTGQEAFPAPAWGITQRDEIAELKRQIQELRAQLGGKPAPS